MRQRAVRPAVVRLGEVERGLVVRDRHERLDAVLLELVDFPAEL